MNFNMYTSQDFINQKSIVACFKTISKKIETHWHEFYEMELILDGEGTYLVDGVEYDIKRGTLFLMSPAAFHNADFLSRCSVINIMFETDLCSHNILYKIFQNNSHIKLCLDNDNISFVESLCRELVNALDKNNSVSEYSVLLLNCILGKVLEISETENNDTPVSPVQRAMLYIQNNFKKDITLSDVAAIANFSPNYFSGVFRKYTGVTYKAYLNNIRFSCAQKLLDYTDMSITDICYECGFNDYANFTSSFKKRFGISPAAFRNKKFADIKKETANH